MKYYYNQAENSFAITTNFEYETTPEGFVEISKERFEELKEALNKSSEEAEATE